MVEIEGRAHASDQVDLPLAPVGNLARYHREQAKYCSEGLLEVERAR